MTPNDTRLTIKQIQILKTIYQHWDDHRQEVDVDQLLESLPYKTSKQSMQFSIRSLIKKGLILKCECEVRRGRLRRVIKVTSFGKTMLGINQSPDDVLVKGV